jgi:hypothetical protein
MESPLLIEKDARVKPDVALDEKEYIRRTEMAERQNGRNGTKLPTCGVSATFGYNMLKLKE